MRERYRTRWSVWLVVVALIAFAGMPQMGNARTSGDRPCDEEPPPFDFSDEFLLENGILPDRIVERPGNPDRNPAHFEVMPPDTPVPPGRRPVRIIETTGGWDSSANLIYYSVMGAIFPDAFERDANGSLTARGARALNVANAFRAFLFPRVQSDGSFIKSPAPPNRRQDNIFDTRNGYFSNNPLGLWILAFVVYTDKAFNTSDGQKELEKLAKKNGLDLDGTPIINKATDIDNLVQKGFVRIVNRSLDGSEGFPWVL